ncbi:MAG: GxxExxY protein [Phycisphaera sp.]|nr:GxxExxY protein [Phycisphaera sp.]
MNADERRCLNEVTERIIGAAMEVSNVLGVGFLEKVYENALVEELKLRGLHGVRQQRLQVQYKGVNIGDYVADLVVENQVIVELKCVEALAPEHTAQCLNYLKATGKHIALLLNFQKPRLDLKRIVLDF